MYLSFEDMKELNGDTAIDLRSKTRTEDTAEPGSLWKSPVLFQA